LKEAPVTIVAGFQCNEGIVLCADSQETISGYVKNYDGKIRTTIFHDASSVISIGGAGDTNYIKTAMDKALVGVGELKNIGDIEKLLEANLLDFFAKHLAPWAPYPSDERPAVELLIGVSTKVGAFGLFHYSGTSFRRTTSAAIGAGILLANSLIHPLTWKLQTLKELSSAALYILFRVKGQVDSCGGFTNLVLMRKGGDAAFTDSREIEKMEGEFSRIDKELEATLQEKIISHSLPKFLWLKDARKRKETSE
jgi:hypothetical protein